MPKNMYFSQFETLLGAGLFAALGGFAKALYDNMSWKQIVAATIIGGVLGVCAYSLCVDYFGLTDKLGAAASGSTGVLSIPILKKAEKLIHNFNWKPTK